MGLAGVDVIRLLCWFAKKVESIIESCCEDEWIKIAKVLEIYAIELEPFE